VSSDVSIGWVGGLWCFLVDIEVDWGTVLMYFLFSESVFITFALDVCFNNFLYFLFKKLFFNKI
jgi:hypothetical protein